MPQAEPVQAALASDTTVEFITSCRLPTPWAVFTMHAFLEHASGKEHLALCLGDVANGEPVLARIHSECLTGDALFSQRCDCGAQLEQALRNISAEGRGVLLYLKQEGRGIGLLSKLKAYHLQDEGADTVEANELLGFAADQRKYCMCSPMLEHLGIHELRLMTNNPRKIESLEQQGVKVVDRIALIVNVNPANRHYLDTKVNKMGHMIPAGMRSYRPVPDATPDNEQD